MSVYDNAKYYDVAFSYRDVKKECNFFKEMYQKHSSKELTSFLEMAAGPARHAVEFSKRGIDSAGLDLEPAMKDYALEKVKEEGTSISYYVMNMSSFKLDKKYDLIVNLLDSLSYILTVEDAFLHFKSIAENLNDGGIYFLEMMHPRNLFKEPGEKKDTQNNWEMKEGNTKVKIEWGNDNDRFDPINLLSEVSVKLEYDDDGKKGIIKEVHKQKAYVLSEIELIVNFIDELSILGTYGDFNLDTPFSDSEESWRMNIVIGKNAV